MILFVIRVAVELFGVAAIGYWGLGASDAMPWQLLLGLGAPALFVVGWGAFLSPKASGPVPADVRPFIGSAVLLGTAVALAVAGQPTLAIGFAAIVVIDHLLLLVIDPQLPAAALAPRA